MLYRKKPSTDLIIESQNEEKEPLNESRDKATKESTETKTFNEKLRGAFSEVIKIYGPPSFRLKALICHFTWCVTSLTCKLLIH